MTSLGGITYGAHKDLGEVDTDNGHLMAEVGGHIVWEARIDQEL